MTKLTEDDLNSMYGVDEDADQEPREQPEQLRLAGRATLIPHRGSNVALARIEYVESLEKMILEQKRLIETMAAQMKKLERRITASQNIAQRKIDAVSSRIKDVDSWRY